MKRIDVLYRYLGSLPEAPSAKHHFEGNCGYSMDRDKDFVTVWDDGQTLVIPRHTLICIHAVA